MRKCNVVYADATERPPIHIMCERERGHDGPHKGSNGIHGAVWTTERRFKVYEGGREPDMMEADPA